mmetsp:Transcript_33171/g.30093  ORF Transcript_33171/g.30093 Transcript_33171/m.30093 type:complete len:163 (-) Transcript_33171:144-632(-)|eukprot:CAMPEP_0114587552 /NCGR_PEP_ID=MMETSP0125-20121206/10486_1 /TAXON_ID=485358 ORGANISM="Aristerostoma sp., Strain ATCC 50986" /NCGR_SAMPLE_ID=MMETSP0125 /ASSEMBLY_ACC=CAM_ASM_000245 /LENGTH=162 /DNA_ID=CAMNT_0001783525 /DNA_START=1521 /DNA_END=2009 /DNA_ORIENTATION=-
MCICYGNIYYENGTAAIVSQYDGEILLDVFDLNNDMNHTVHSVLNTVGLLKQIDDDNVLISVPGTANLNAHMTVFNLATLQVIWEGFIPKTHALTAFYTIIPMAVKIEDNKVVSGKIVLGDTNYDTFVYDMATDSLEKIEVPGVYYGLSILASSISDTQIAA